MPIHAERAKHNDGGGCENSLDKAAGEDSCVPSARRPIHYRRIDRLYTQRLGRWTVHENILTVTLAQALSCSPRST